MIYSKKSVTLKKSYVSFLEGFFTFLQMKSCSVIVIIALTLLSEAPTR